MDRASSAQAGRPVPTAALNGSLDQEFVADEKARIHSRPISTAMAL